MKKKHLSALAATVAAMIALPAIAQTPATLSLTATSEVQAAPDIADIGAGVITRATDANSAMTANAAQMARVVAALRKAGVADRDIQTSGLNLQPQFRYEQNQPPVLTGFQASNRVSVTLRDVKGAGRIIDTLVAEGANQIDGPNFRVDKPEPLLDKARQDAVRKGLQRAELYAKAAGLRVKRILSIAEGFADRPPPMPMPRMAMAMEASADSPVAPGEVSLSASVSMTFELE